MSRDAEKARKLLEENAAYTCVLCRGETVYISCKNGIAPMIDWISQETELQGFAAADRIVGKAAAFLFLLAGVKEVYGAVMSETALKMLEEQRVTASFGEKTDRIINRAGTDICPMEKAVADIETPTEAYEAIRKTLERLTGA